MLKDFEANDLSKSKIQVVKIFCQNSPAKAQERCPKVDTQSHMYSNYNDSIKSRDLLRHTALNLVRSDNNLDHVTSYRDYDSRVRIDCQTQPKLKTELQVMFDKIRNKRLSRIMDEIDPKSMNLTSKKVINSPTKNVKTSKNELRSINEVLKYDKRASPIRKSSSNRVKNVVRDLEKAQNKKRKAIWRNSSAK